MKGQFLKFNKNVIHEQTETLMTKPTQAPLKDNRDRVAKSLSEENPYPQ